MFDDKIGEPNLQVIAIVIPVVALCQNESDKSAVRETIHDDLCMSLDNIKLPLSSTC